ncbi:MAG: 30S ribosomal protein S2 [Chloroflexi bacterium]|nr:30S ribosomal protein S2 [Chloroflexota bacterium]
MPKISMKALLESGVHFGHRTHRWNPNMRPYIFTERNGIHIIDLQQTVKALGDVYKLVRDKVAEGGTILFVGTKRQAVDNIQDEAERCGMPFVTVRWLGGMLTNWRTMRERISELERLERMREKGDFERLTKKEGLMLTRKIDKLEARFGGIRKMHGLPDLLFVVDVRREDTAVREANLLQIPVVAMVDTNCDPRNIDHVVPSNDDAIRAIKLLVAHIASAVLEGRAMRDESDEDDFVPVDAKVDEAKVEELSDADLLGEATLAKMTAQAEVDAVEAEATARYPESSQEEIAEKEKMEQEESSNSDAEASVEGDEEESSDGDAEASVEGDEEESSDGDTEASVEGDEEKTTEAEDKE